MIVVRKAIPADYPAMQQLLIELVSNAELWVDARSRRERMKELEWFRSGRWAQERQGPGFLDLVAVADGEVVGVLLSNWRPWCVGAAFIGVAARRRGQGVGSALMRELERAARRARQKWIHLFVAPWRGRVIRFFERQGFRRPPAHRRFLRDSPISLMLEKDVGGRMPLFFRGVWLLDSLMRQVEGRLLGGDSWTRRVVERLERAGPRGPACGEGG